MAGPHGTTSDERAIPVTLTARTWGAVLIGYTGLVITSVGGYLTLREDVKTNMRENQRQDETIRETVEALRSLTMTVERMQGREEAKR